MSSAKHISGSIYKLVKLKSVGFCQIVLLKVYSFFHRNFEYLIKLDF